MSGSQDLIDLVSRVLAGLAVALQVALVALVIALLLALVSPRARALLVELRGVFARPLVWCAWVVALVATSGSLFYSEYADYPPCELCWYQRIAMYPLVAILLIAALRRDMRGAAFYGVPLAVLGALVSVRHIYVEYNPEADTCSAGGAVPCAVKWIDELGYITIPVLALTTFAAIAVLLAVALSQSRADERRAAAPQT